MRGLIFSAALLVQVGALAAQTGPERTDLFDDWAVFVSEEPGECFATTRALNEAGWPEGTESSGAQILVTFRPPATASTAAPPGADLLGSTVLTPELAPVIDPVTASTLPGEVSFWTGGPDITPGTALGVRAGDARFPLFSNGSWAWPPSPAADAAAIEALAAADRAEISLLTEGTVPVVAVFSLVGFASAVEAAQLHCAGLALLGGRG